MNISSFLILFLILRIMLTHQRSNHTETSQSTARTSTNRFLNEGKIVLK